ncbi:MAG: hypothetical protein IKU40_09555 [Clostridia bacterium]|nr:hypothetical protein [Clostridia bacterium]
MNNETNLSSDVENKPKVSKKQQACVNRYVAANYDRINVTFKKGEKDFLRMAADKANKSVNAYIVDAVHEAMVRDGFPVVDNNEENNPT